MNQLIQEIKAIVPHMAIKVKWELDPYESWNGDGPNPRDDGYSPYNVTVTSYTIVGGELLSGDESLGGCWEDPKN